MERERETKREREREKEREKERKRERCGMIPYRHVRYLYRTVTYATLSPLLVHARGSDLLCS
jgi:hypothetical protein